MFFRPAVYIASRSTDAIDGTARLKLFQRVAEGHPRHAEVAREDGERSRRIIQSV
jgi:hypothetical protein